MSVGVESRVSVRVSLRSAWQPLLSSPVAASRFLSFAMTIPPAKLCIQAVMSELPLPSWKRTTNHGVKAVRTVRRED